MQELWSLERSLLRQLAIEGAHLKLMRTADNSPVLAISLPDGLTPRPTFSFVVEALERQCLIVCLDPSEAWPEWRITEAGLRALFGDGTDT